MTGYCLMPADINKCKFFLSDQQECAASDDKCGMFQPMEPVRQARPAEYVRKPRWYEKYYHEDA